jgi:hypothetical protein
MINVSIFNEQEQANELSSGTSNTNQRCPTINKKVQKQMEVLAWNFFLSSFIYYLLFSFEQVTTESK